MALLSACAVPGFITGSVVLQLRADFALGETALGIAFSIYWGVAAVASAPAGWVAERIGPLVTMRLAAAIAAASSAAIAVWVDSAAALIALLAVGGVSIAAATPAVNTLILRGVRGNRRALAFGLAQANLPVGLLLAGVAVPAIAEPVGWRAVFAAAAALALAAAVAAPRPEDAPAAAPAEAAPESGHASLRRLAALSAAISLGTGGVGALNAFLVAAAPEAGLSGGQAALTLALGSGLSIGARIVAGLGADRRPAGGLTAVAAMLAVGAAGFGLVTTEAPVAFVGGALLVLTFGWGWMGLFAFAVVSRYAHAPERASGIMQTGAFTGGVLGPVAFGLIAEAGSFSLAWLITGAAAVVAAAVVFAGRSLTAPATGERAP